MDEIGEPGENNAEIDTFIWDIQCILQDITKTHEKNITEIKDHYKNIASNPEDFYSAKEQVSILLEIMKCYNINMVEYQQNMRELGIITKTIIKAHNEHHSSNKNHRTSTESSLSLYDYFIQLIWGNPIRKIAVEPDREPSVDLASIFINHDVDIIEHSFAEATTRPTIKPNIDISKKTSKRRNTIQPIITYIPHTMHKPHTSNVNV